jgi:hypothetical protein
MPRRNKNFSYRALIKVICGFIGLIFGIVIPEKNQTTILLVSGTLYLIFSFLQTMKGKEDELD